MEVSTGLFVESVDFNSRENAKHHHTNMFELVEMEPPKTVLRRGQSFTIRVNLKDNRFDPQNHKIRAVFSLGSAPNVKNFTQGVAEIDVKMKRLTEQPNKWEGIIREIGSDSFIMEVRSPCGAPVGLWYFQLEIKQIGDGKKEIYTHPEGIYMLFNPWMEDDQVYMRETELLEEYVLNDVGKIWRGSHHDAVGKPWAYGQFDDTILPACMLILKKSNVTEADHGDPVKVVRAISKLVNVNDEDGGIVYGRWDEKYDDGTPPYSWTGSVPILEEYLRTGNGVKYGQCWVFAAVVTTVCRALGIACRPVSNMVSAHDTNCSLTIDKYIDKNNKPIKRRSLPGAKDTIWNYHVWNDVWMARPDLPKGYGGWQAIDATPQEKSDGYYQCGPASVEAIKTGTSTLDYDVPFIIAEVNADVMNWKEDPESELGFKRILRNKYEVGRSLLTKRPGIFDPDGESDVENIINQYKQHEDSPEERACLYNAVRENKWAKRLFSLPSGGENDVLFDLNDIETVPLGKMFQAKVKVVNISNEERNIQIWLTAESVYYNGVKGKMIKSSDDKYLVKPNISEVVSLSVHPEEYVDKLVEQCMIKIKAIACVSETKQTWADEDDLQIIKPRIKIKVPTSIRKDQPVTIKLHFENPLKRNLTKSKFNITAAGLIKPTSIGYGDIKQLGEIIKEYTFVPKKIGSFTLVATFHSEELTDVSGSLVIKIKE